MAGASTAAAAGGGSAGTGTGHRHPVDRRRSAEAARFTPAGSYPADRNQPARSGAGKPADDSSSFDRLRAVAVELGLSTRAYRVGAAAEGSWSVLREGSDWAVFRTEHGVRHDLAAFPTSLQAAAYLIGQLCLSRENDETPLADEPETAAPAAHTRQRPIPEAPARAPVAHTPPEGRTIAAPVRTAGPVPPARAAGPPSPAPPGVTAGIAGSARGEVDAGDTAADAPERAAPTPGAPTEQTDGPAPRAGLLGSVAAALDPASAHITPGASLLPPAGDQPVPGGAAPDGRSAPVSGTDPADDAPVADAQGPNANAAPGDAEPAGGSTHAGGTAASEDMPNGEDGHAPVTGRAAPIGAAPATSGRTPLVGEGTPTSGSPAVTGDTRRASRPSEAAATGGTESTVDAGGASTATGPRPAVTAPAEPTGALGGVERGADPPAPTGEPAQDATGPALASGRPEPPAPVGITPASTDPETPAPTAELPGTVHSDAKPGQLAPVPPVAGSGQPREDTGWSPAIEAGEPSSTTPPAAARSSITGSAGGSVTGLAAEHGSAAGQVARRGPANATAEPGPASGEPLLAPKAAPAPPAAPAGAAAVPAATPAAAVPAATVPAATVPAATTPAAASKGAVGGVRRARPSDLDSWAPHGGTAAQPQPPGPQPAAHTSQGPQPGTGSSEAAADGTPGGATGASQQAPAQWKIQPLPGEPPLTLYRDKRMVLLPAGTELDRYGEATGNVAYAANTGYGQRSLPADWSDLPYHAYRLRRDLEALSGVAVPWFGQPGGGTAFVLSRSIVDLVADGSLVEVEGAAPPG